MRAKEFTVEAFDQPYDMSWEKGEVGEDYDALVRLPDGSNLSIMFNEEGPGQYMVEFWRGAEQSVTGEGDAQRIFATVLAAIAKFIQQHRPQSIVFSAHKEDDPEQKSDSRSKLYNRLVQRYAGTMGYSYRSWDTGDSVQYELTRLKPGVAEGLTEIENMPARNFDGERMLRLRIPAKQNLQPLLGGTDLLYAVDQAPGGDPRVVIVEPGVRAITKPQIVAVLQLEPVDYLPNTVQVGFITVDKDYRGRGLAKALYGIVFTKMRKNLLSGDEQTPGGKRNWMSLVNMPGVEVKGMVRISNDIFDLNKNRVSSNYQKYIDQTMDQIMELGGQFFHKNKDFSFWLFDVVPGKGQLQPYVQNSLSKLYGYDARNLLLATWNRGTNESQQGVAEDSLNEFLDDRDGDDGEGISQIVTITDRLLKQGYRVDLAVIGAMGRVYRADLEQTGFTPNGALAIKRKTRHFLRPFKIDDDDLYEFELVAPKHYKIVDSFTRSDDPGVAEGLNEFAPDGFNGGDDDEGFSPEIAKMAQEDGFTKGVSLADGATLEMAMKINYWHTQHGGMYKQYFAKGFKQGRMNKIKHDNKQYNLNLKLMKDGSIRHGEQGVAENFADGKVKGKSRPGRVKRAGASCNGSVTDLRQRAKNASGEKAKMYHWCANMKSGKKK